MHKTTRFMTLHVNYDLLQDNLDYKISATAEARFPDQPAIPELQKERELPYELDFTKEEAERTIDKLTHILLRAIFNDISRHAQGMPENPE